MVTYGRRLTDHDFDVNGILFVITDGADNASTLTAREVGKVLAEAPRRHFASHLPSILESWGHFGRTFTHL